MVKQLSVFLENKPNQLLFLLKVLYDNDINITSLAIADTGEYGVTRLIVTDMEKALTKLSEAGLKATETEVLAVLIDNAPGMLYQTTKLLTDNGINVEYAYSALPDNRGKAIVIFRVDYLASAVKVINDAENIDYIEEL